VAQAVADQREPPLHEVDADHGRGEPDEQRGEQRALHEVVLQDLHGGQPPARAGPPVGRPVDGGQRSRVPGAPDRARCAVRGVVAGVVVVHLRVGQEGRSGAGEPPGAQAGGTSAGAVVHQAAVVERDHAGQHRQQRASPHG
jgi:hypothetical protein